MTTTNASEQTGQQQASVANTGPSERRGTLEIVVAPVECGWVAVDVSDWSALRDIGDEQLQDQLLMEATTDLVQSVHDEPIPWESFITLASGTFVPLDRKEVTIESFRAMGHSVEVVDRPTTHIMKRRR